MAQPLSDRRRPPPLSRAGGRFTPEPISAPAGWRLTQRTARPPRLAHASQVGCVSLHHVLAGRTVGMPHGPLADAATAPGAPPAKLTKGRLAISALELLPLRRLLLLATEEGTVKVVV